MAAAVTPSMHPNGQMAGPPLGHEYWRNAPPQQSTGTFYSAYSCSTVPYDPSQVNAAGLIPPSARSCSTGVLSHDQSQMGPGGTVPPSARSYSTGLISLDQHQVPHPSVAPPWFQQHGGASMPHGSQFQWPAHAPYYGGPQWQGPAPHGAAPIPQDQQVAMQPPSPCFQSYSPRMPSPRLAEEANAGMYPYGAGVGMPPMMGDAAMYQNYHAAAIPEAAENDGSKKQGLLSFGACRSSCRSVASKLACKSSKHTQRGRQCCAALADRFLGCLGSFCGPCMASPAVQSSDWRRKWMTVVVFLGACGSLLASLVDSQPHILAAGLASAMGWLACYAYMMQQECVRLKGDLESDVGSQLTEKGRKAAEAMAAQTAPPSSDLDMTGMLASILGPGAPSKGKSGQTMQAVLVSALVNEYLRCSKMLKRYQSKHGMHPQAPTCSPSFAEALMSGLGTSAPGSFSGGTAFQAPTTTRSRPDACAAAGTDNLADRLAAVNSTSPVPALSLPKPDDQSGLSDVFGTHSSSAGSLVPPPPSSGELDRCHTIDAETDAPMSMTPVRDDAPAARAPARYEDLEENPLDPAWLKPLRNHWPIIN